jgi:hypothetical protein
VIWIWHPGSGKNYEFSVADPNPEPNVFHPTSQRYGSGSVSFYHHAKIVRKKTLFPSILLLFLTFYLWKIMSM